jgi:hypothetical protein
VAAIGPDDAPIEGVSDDEWKKWLVINTDYFKEKK